MTTEDLWTEDHSRTVAEAAPAVPRPDQVEIDHAWTVIEAGIGRPHRHRRPVRVALAGAGTALVVGLAGTAAAGIINAHTGKGPTDQEDLRLGGPGERLDLAGTDLATVIAQITRDIPFPSQRDRRISNDTQYRENTTAVDLATSKAANRATACMRAAHDLAKSGDALDRRLAPRLVMRCAGSRPEGSAETDEASTSALRGWTVDDAICSWANTWTAAVRSDDAPVKQAATRQLKSAESWSAVRALDTTFAWRPRGEGTRFGYLSLVENASHGDDVEQMAAALTADDNPCTAALVPDIPQAAMPQGSR